MSKPKKVLSVDEPTIHSYTLESVQEAISYIRDSAEQHIMQKIGGSPEHMLRGAIYMVREDLNKRYLQNPADDNVINARAAMENLDRLFRQSVKFKWVPVVSNKIRNQLCAQIQEINNKDILSPCKTPLAESAAQDNSVKRQSRQG